MLGVGWTELLLVGVVALIVIGPKDLPDVMRKLGKVVGTVRRMGSEFQRELNKTTGLDQITDIRRSITEPLRQTGAEIAKEFNAIGKDGTVNPSGALKPTDPAVESVVDAINKQAGIAAPAPEANAAASAAIAKAVTDSVKAETAKMAAATAKPVAAPKPVAAAKPAAKRVPKAKPVPTVPVTRADLPPVAEAAAKPARKPRAKAAEETAATPAKAPAKTETAAPLKAKPAPVARTTPPKPAEKPAAAKKPVTAAKAGERATKPRAGKS